MLLFKFYKSVIMTLMIGDEVMRKYTKMILTIMLLIFTICFESKVNAETDYRLSTEFEKTIEASYTSSYVDKVTYNNITILKKYFSSVKNEGKAICTLFDNPAPKGTCTATYWNKDSTLNKKIAVAIGAMITKARALSGGATTWGINWEHYFYLEMAINNFLYNYNGKNDDNKVSDLINWSSVSNNTIYKNIYASGVTAYGNYNKYATSVTLSSPTFAVSEDNKTVTATVKATCRNTSGNQAACNLTTTSLKITGTDSNGNAVSKTISKPTSSTKSSTNVLTLKYTVAFDNAFAAGDNVKGYFYVKNKLAYGIAQNYNCGRNYQMLTPNSVKTLYLYGDDDVTKTAGTTNCSITINKLSENSNALSGAVFYLYSDAAGKVKIDATTSNSQGKAVFSGLAAGTYYYKEVKAPNGYVLDSSIKPISVSETSGVCVATSNVVNKKTTGNLTINKVDLNDNPVVGAKIKIYTIENNPDYVEDNNSNEETEVTLPDINDEEFGTDYTGSDNEKYLYNYLYFDAEGNYVPGITSSEDGKYFDYFITGETAKTITGLTVGQTYNVVEEALPENSDYSAKVREDAVLIEEGGKTYSVKLVNVHSKFSISKQDITSKQELPGAILEIRDSRDIAIQSWTSTDKPQEIIGLADGDYTLVEITAPNGYNVSESISFTIEDGKLKDDADNTLVMYDSVVVDVPDTFTTKNIITMIAGLVLVTAGTSVLVYEIKKKKTA